VTDRGPTEPRGGLWRHRDFLRLWSAQSISVLGSQVTILALPLAAILVLDASAFEVALLTAVEYAPFLVFALPAGVWVDRWPRRPVLIVADIGRALVLLSVPAAYAADILTIWQLYAVAFTTGVLTVFFDVAYMSYLPALVRRDQLVEGNAKLEISRSSAFLAGPGLGGGLVEILKAPVAVLLDALSFVASAVLIARIRRGEDVAARSEAERGGMRAELVEGLRYVLREPHIRAIASSTTTFNFFSNVTWALLLVYAVRHLELTPGVIGLIFGIGNVGSLAAAFTSGWISRRLRIGRAIVLGAMGGVAMLLVPLASKETAVPFLIASGVIVGFGVVLYNTAGISLMQAITPDRLLGRMNASRRFLVWGTIPLGALVGGAIAAVTDVRTAIWVGAIGNSLAFLPVLLSPVRSLREIPETEHPTSRDVADAAPEPIVS
jgi:MFS family permease